MPSPRDLFVRNILFYCFDDDGLGFITQLNYSSLLEVMFPDFVECVLRALEKRETSTSEARARDARANRETGFSTNLRIQYGDGSLTRRNTCVVKWI